MRRATTDFASRISHPPIQADSNPDLTAEYQSKTGIKPTRPGQPRTQVTTSPTPTFRLCSNERQPKNQHNLTYKPHALPLVALLVAQPLAPLVALLVGQAVALLVACWWWLVVGVLEWRGTARRVAVPSLGFCCVVAVSYSPTTYRLQYHWRCRA